MSFLGKGGLSTVIRVSDHYALKILSDERAAKQEAQILERLGNCSTIVGFYGRLGDVYGTGAALLLELCQSSLADLLSTLVGQRLPGASGLSTQQYVVMMLNCVAQLHGRGVIHQDIKPSNFLFARDGSVKLCDFNLSRVATDSPRTTGGTLLYFSPQKFTNTDDGYAADWWALGVTLYQMLHGLHTWPFSSRSLRSVGKLPGEEQVKLVRTAVMKGNLTFRTLSGLPRAARTLIRGLLHPKPERRWSLLQVLAGDYPADQAFSAVALRYPHLGPDMESLLAIRRLCRAGSSPWRPVAWTWREPPDDTDGLPVCGLQEDATQAQSQPQPASAATSIRTRRSLGALGSCLPSRKRPYSYSGAPHPERDDLFPADQLAPGAPEAAPTPATSTAAGAALTTTCAAATGPRTGSPMGPGVVGMSVSCEMSVVPVQAPGSEFGLPLRDDLRAGRPAAATATAGLEWTTDTRGRCLAGAFPRVCALRRALLPRSDAAARAAAARVATAPPPCLLTADGRLTAPVFVPCDVRAHTLDLTAVCRALEAVNAATAAAADCPDSGPQEAVGCSTRVADTRGQVQGVEVLEEMRLMLERRRLSTRATATGSDAADTAGAAARHPPLADDLAPSTVRGSRAGAPAEAACPTACVTNSIGMAGDGRSMALVWTDQFTRVVPEPEPEPEPDPDPDPEVGGSSAGESVEGAVQRPAGAASLAARRGVCVPDREAASATDNAVAAAGRTEALAAAETGALGRDAAEAPRSRPPAPRLHCCGRGGAGDGAQPGGLGSAAALQQLGTESGCHDADVDVDDDGDGDPQALITASNADEVGSLFSLPMTPAGRSALPQLGAAGCGDWGSEAAVLEPDGISPRARPQQRLAGVEEGQDPDPDPNPSRGSDTDSGSGSDPGLGPGSGLGLGMRMGAPPALEDDRPSWGSGTGGGLRGLPPAVRDAAGSAPNGRIGPHAALRVPCSVEGGEMEGSETGQMGASPRVSPSCGAPRSAPCRFSGLAAAAAAGGGIGCGGGAKARLRSARTATAALGGGKAGVQQRASDDATGGAPPSRPMWGAASVRSWSVRGKGLLRVIRQAGA